MNVTQKILACVCGDSKVELGMLKAKVWNDHDVIANYDLLGGSCCETS